MRLFRRLHSRSHPSIEHEGFRAVILEHWPDDPPTLAQWQALAALPQYTFFHTPLWQQAVWKRLHRHGRLRLVLVHKGNDLVGALPLGHTPKAGCQTPAPHITDYLDPLIAPDCIPQAAIMILKLLCGQSSLSLHNMRCDAPSLSAWRTAAQAENWSLEQTTVEQCPCLTLPPDVDEWMRRLDPHFRKELRRKIRKVMDKGDGRLQTCPPADAQRGIEQLLVLMQHRGQKAIDVQRTLGPILRDAAPQLIREGRLQLSILMIKNSPAAAILETVSPAGPMLYNSGFDTAMKPWSPGLVAVALSIMRSIEQRHRQYDFLRGEEPYKYDFGAQNRALLRLTLRPM